MSCKYIGWYLDRNFRLDQWYLLNYLYAQLLDEFLIGFIFSVLKIKIRYIFKEYMFFNFSRDLLIYIFTLNPVFSLCCFVLMFWFWNKQVLHFLSTETYYFNQLKILMLRIFYLWIEFVYQSQLCVGIPSCM